MARIPWSFACTWTEPHVFVLLSLPVLRRVSARLYLADDRQVSETDRPRNF